MSGQTVALGGKGNQMADWWKKDELVSAPSTGGGAAQTWGGGDELVSNAPLSAPATGAPVAAPAAQSIQQSIANRLKYINDIATMGYWDKISAGLRSAAGGPSYEEALKQERAQTKAAGEQLGTAEKVLYGAAGMAPLALAGGPLGIAAKTAGSVMGGGRAAAALARMAAPSTTVGRVAAGAAEGAGLGALEAAGRDTDIATGAALGGAIGAGVPAAFAGAKRLISPVRAAPSAATKELIDAAEKAGITLTPAQKSGSRALTAIESQLRDLPGGGASPRIAQAEQLNRRALESAGIRGESLASTDVLGAGFDKLSAELPSLLPRTVRISADLTKKVTQAVDDYSGDLSSNVKGILLSRANELIDKKGSIVSGNEMAKTRSALGELQRRYAAINPQLSVALGALRRAVDEEIDRALPTDAARSALRDWRGKYQNLSRIDEVMKSAGNQSLTEQIPFKKLENLIKRKRGAYATGKGVSSATKDLSELAKIGSYLESTTPSSGTAQRNWVTDIITRGAGAGAGFSLGGIVGSVIGGAAAPYAANLAYNNPLTQKYLTNQLAGRLSNKLPLDPETRRRLVTYGLLGQ